MREFVYEVKDPMGMHARPAGLFVKEASKFASTVTVAKGEKQADAKKIFGVMGLGIKQGEQLKVMLEGIDEAAAAAALEEFLNKNL